ncbi:MAG TPA: 3-deoxy-D-manno-octulosonic acid transferase, partial [Rhodopila sp.]|nr:3-deoxy-D-manno-octulosonic acid transferase [Rhodopila sp.]
RAAKGREIAERLDERFGIDPTPRPAGTLIWMHAASVGETVSILPVLQALGSRATVLLTTGTVTSQVLLESRIPELGLTGHVLHRFAPLDVPAWVRRFLSHWRPDAACFVESELWPNQLALCRRRGIPLMLLNARMSDRSLARWRRVPALSRHVLSAFTAIRARGPQDADRLRALGAADVEDAGDLKFAAPPLPVDRPELIRLRRLLGERPVWLAASTHPGEDEIAAAAHRILAERHADLLTIIAPRHPDRGRALAAGLNAPRRSARENPPATSGIFVADTVGELGLWYRLAPVALVGRSLVPPGGGQNPLEPARLGCAVAVGPHTANFTDHIALLQRAGALSRVTDAGSLADFVTTMLSNPDRRSQVGDSAARALAGYEDLAARTAGAVLALLDRALTDRALPDRH